MKSGSRARHGEILEAHLRRAVLTNRYSTVRTDEFNIELADGRQAYEIVCPSHEARK